MLPFIHGVDLEAIEELDSIRAYDSAKASGDVSIPFEKKEE
ncbi:MAG: hypothetical protein AAB296_07075 [Candidatus Desantisbacteria bacterium]